MKNVKLEAALNIDFIVFVWMLVLTRE